MTATVVIITIVVLWVVLSACIGVAVCMLSSRLSQDGISPRPSRAPRPASYPAETSPTGSQPVRS